ncbi:hypothetical protein AKJ37_05725 [candidate division MSBL1 archaeon SCGC-AAA259I09]|uniref:Carnitine dehydratase n=2 Tax=candidate division MSBL1 TaxID=215777 RepID=A0A133UQ34_9EURY|nr:hypothetical protein AKJ62_01030 [candidate division MSBL1 archaeon SCGC-AAA259D14]KXA96237.1 hypothetical protein AKJ37_05725 [candidate division MSBL1 archaeon SCGC-AAA259I09]
MKLNRVKVLDLTRLLPGPFGTMLLADLGAEVIKIEDPEVGDYARYQEPSIEGMGALFTMVNRNKKSIELDLNSEKGKEVFMKLAEEADVIFEQFRPGVVEKLGIDYESVKKTNPETIYCSLSGFGQDGPYRDRVGHDLNYISLAGLLDITRSEGNDPAIPGFPIADMAGGLFSAFAIVSALLDRELNDSGGEYIDVSMLEAVMSLSSGSLSWIPLVQDEAPKGRETLLTGKYPCYDYYETKDKRYVTLAALEPKFWENFCEAIGKKDLKDKHYSEDEEREKVRKIIAKKFKSRTMEEWEEVLGEKEIMFTPVKNLKEAYQDEQIKKRGFIGSVQTNGQKVKQLGFPAKSSKNIDEFRDGSPKQGEHTKKVLKEIGYSCEEIEELAETGVI